MGFKDVLKNLFSTSLNAFFTAKVFYENSMWLTCDSSGVNY